MLLFGSLLVLSLVISIAGKTYLYNTEDGAATMFYDCIPHAGAFYCRRPAAPITLERDDEQLQCYHNGTIHWFADLLRDNVRVDTVLHHWRSTLEKVEQYARYLGSSDKVNALICNCTNERSFGKNCEYLYPAETTFVQTLAAQSLFKRINPVQAQLYGDVMRYTTLQCVTGPLGLDWRDICDGAQQCALGEDEANCDKLEYNECENDEYRCMSGMCIPDEYFLDGVFDCLDWSDELPYYSDTNCPIEETNFYCDERVCPPNQFSCGDGQCLPNRFEFQTSIESKLECRSRREQYFLCETHHRRTKWTLESGRCFEGVRYEGPERGNRTQDEECQYLLRCALSGGVEKHCPCGRDVMCDVPLRNACASNATLYPQAGFMAPYVNLFYYRSRSWTRLSPDFAWINGTLKCLEGWVTVSGSFFSYISTLPRMEESVCRYARSQSWPVRDDPAEHSHRRTFDHRPYRTMSVCLRSHWNVSTYRIKDGFDNCINKLDETKEINIDAVCSTTRRHRFRCSSSEPTCLSVAALGNLQNNCENKFDELWFGKNVSLLTINCNSLRTDQCDVLRQYIETSWTDNMKPSTSEQLRIPFHQYCDTFADLVSKEDESPTECRNSWVCPEDKWRCHNGQCIHMEWVLDGEWDCVDASDEDNLFYWRIEERNLKLLSLAKLKEKWMQRNKSRPFASLCDLTTEFPCLPVRLSQPLHNLTHNPPCISRDRVGDHTPDCHGAIDERNTLSHCKQPITLGYDYYCKSTQQCIPYWSHCVERCNDTLDDHFWCDHRQNLSTYVDTFADTFCFNGTYVKNGRCNHVVDCLYSEDEYMCEYVNFAKLSGVPYRSIKASTAEKANHALRLPPFPTTVNVTDTLSSTSPPPAKVPSWLYNQSDALAYRCNRGVGVHLANQSFACFCPPQYYGDKCQHHADRLTVLFHLNFSQSTYMIERDFQTVLKLVILYLHENEVIMSYVSHVRPETDLFTRGKKILHFPHPRLSTLLEQKQRRRVNRTDVTHRHPYAVRIEIYERKHRQSLVLTSIWQYPIYFDYLPVVRLAEVLRLAPPTFEPNPCSSQPCPANADCRQLMNDGSKYVCLCKENFFGENCTIKDHRCISGYCRPGSTCKPKYRGLLNANDFPLCLCAAEHYGEHCGLQYEQCASKPCLNNGTCYPASRPGSYICQCHENFHGPQCQLRKPEIRLQINASAPHVAAVVQYFDIDFDSMDLLLAHQSVHEALPPTLRYRHREQTAPEVVLAKLYSPSLADPADVYLLAVYVNMITVDGITQATEHNRCPDIRTSDLNNGSFDSPITYHKLCERHRDLLCFRDEFYLCICESNRTRVECFRYDAHLEHCSHCLAGGQCLHGDRRQPNDFVCLCPRCHSGTRCQFNSNSFGFTLDQLFFADLISSHASTSARALLIIPLLLFLLAIPCNLFSFLTFRQANCLTNGVGHYLLCMSILSQVNLAVLVARLIHLVFSITDWRSHTVVDHYLCKILGYLLTSSSRMVYWLSSLVAIERVSMTVFRSQRWLRKPRTARRLILIALVGILVSDAHELAFVKSLPRVNTDTDSMCVLEFPQHNRSAWLFMHRTLFIINSMAPLLINMCCMLTIIYKVTKTKMHAHGRKSEYSAQTSPVLSIWDNLRATLRLAGDVVREKKELVIGPAITLIPQLFSLPLFIVSLTLYCQELERSSLRYLLILSYFTTFMPQMINFMVYVLPSSVYTTEWYNTNIGRWFGNLWHRQRPIPAIVISSEATNEIKNTLTTPSI